MALKWGIASAAKISHDFVAAVHTLPSGEHEFVAVAARSLEDASKFGRLHNIPKHYEGYKQLALDSEIEIVYVGAIHPYHHSITKMMLEHGKHVLCEKPFTMCEKQTNELLELAKTKKLFLMEAVWSRWFPVYKELKKQIDSGIIGDVICINASLGFPLQDIPRCMEKDLGGGGILDLGLYAMQFVQYVYRGLKPGKLVATGHLNKYGTDDTTGAVIVYPGNKLAVVNCSTVCLLSNEAVVVGTKGIITIPNFLCPTEMKTPEKNFKFELPIPSLPLNFDNGGGMAYEAIEVRRCIRGGLLESPNMPHSETLELSQLLDAYKKDVGVAYKEDML